MHPQITTRFFIKGVGAFLYFENSSLCNISKMIRWWHGLQVAAWHFTIHIHYENEVHMMFENLDVPLRKRVVKREKGHFQGQDINFKKDWYLVHWRDQISLNLYKNQYLVKKIINYIIWIQNSQAFTNLFDLYSIVQLHVLFYFSTYICLIRSNFMLMMIVS